MGRPPKKLEELNKQNEDILNSLPDVETEIEVIPAKNVEKEAVKIELKDTLYSVVKNPENQQYAVVELSFDFKTKTFGELKVIEENIDRYVSIERFRIIVGNGLMS